MDRDSLRVLLAEGLSLAEIGRRYGKDASTVGYWVRKHGLEANGTAKYAPRGGIPRARLEGLVADGRSMRAIAEELELSLSTVRHWMRRYELTTRRIRRLAATKAAYQVRLITSTGFRCGRCASEAVSAGGEK